MQYYRLEVANPNVENGMEKKGVPNFYKTAPLTTHKDSSTK